MVDVWYEDERKNINKISVLWSDCDCVYSGNLYVNEKPVGDYTANDWEQVERIAKIFGIVIQ